MAQHWLETPAARDLPLDRVLRMSEDQAYSWFYRARWGRAEPVCPYCGVLDAYRLTRNGRRMNRFKCRASECWKEFSVTSQTIFANHKLSFRKMLSVMALFVHSVKGKAALQICREVGITYKSAWVLLMKLREALSDAEPDEPLDGIVEMDAAHVKGHVRPANRRQDRVDRRLVENEDPAEPQAIMALRQRAVDGLFADRVFATVTPGEIPEYSQDLARRKVAPRALIITDEHGAYANLDLVNRRGLRIRHADNYAAGEGLNTNHVESFFTRVRRSQKGIHHRVSGFYLELYVAGLAWQENARRKLFSQKLFFVLDAGLNHRISRKFCKYWQGNHVQEPLQWQLDAPA